MPDNSEQVKNKPKKFKIKKKEQSDNDNTQVNTDVKYTNNSDINLINGDCLIEMDKIEKNSINCIITDLPYGVSLNKWDTIIDLDEMWKLFKKILKIDGIVILTASGKFVAKLMMSNINMFKYDLIWEKTVNSGQLNVKKMPLRSHENILIFYNKNRTYNEQKTKGEPYKIKRADTTGEGFGKQKESEKNNEGYRHARSVIKISNPRKKGGHPTQKPVELMEYLIKTFSNQNDTILDCCMGCGSTGIAAKKNNRKFIGIELEKKYFDIAKKDITELKV
jgi:site-specific DNA-methyltransferase (adenine-specific)